MKSKYCNSSTANDIALLEHLPTMARDQLLRLWIDLFKLTPPVAISRQLLERGLAYALQESQFGSLSSRTRKDLQKISHSADENNVGKATLGQSQAKPNGGQSKARSPTVSLSPGMRLVREWQGRSHVVDVREDGFQWNDRIYRSLSALASDITGAKWSGPRFFGL